MNYRSKKYAAMLLAALIPAAATAQDKPCIPVNKANAKRTLDVTPALVTYRSWKDQRNIQISLYAGKTGTDSGGKRFPDSVAVRYPGGMSAGFLAKGPEVASSVVSYSSKEGEWITDSIDLSGRYQRPGYYAGPYHSSHVIKTSYPSRRAVLYYHVSGADSLYIAQYPDGQPELITWYRRYGGDSLTKAYDREGLLRWHRSPSEEAGYKQGRLSLVSFDTLVNGWTVKGRKEYHDNGRLRAVSYYNADTPVLTWQYYREDGSLLRTEKKKSIAGKAPGRTYEVAAAPTEGRFMLVEQMPDYPGGYLAFKDMLNTLVREAVCQTNQPLDGLYLIQLDIDAAGKMTLGGVSGQHAEAMAEKLRPLVSGLQRWIPGKVNGIPLDATRFSVTLTIK